MEPEKIKLPNVTLAAMTSINIYETIHAMEYSMQGVEFADAILITHRRPFRLPKNIRYKHTSKLSDIDAFNYKMVYELADYIDTDYVLLVHYDGFVVNPESWRDEFLDYDYIGSPWPLPENDYAYRDAKGNISRVGNSVSIRSKRLLQFPRQAHLKWEQMEDGNYNEDTFLCCKYKNRIEDAGMKFAPIEVAKYFGHEHMIPEIEDVEKPFVFHKWWGRNAKYPHFVNPWKVRWQKVKDVLRPFLFWRKIHDL
ncbi:MAG: hypothetical protein NC321_03075 [Clostridium sp.]|nr:hypothetical protein [Lachnoclostridium sp.]MCM1251777.1 hypothetical protein [Clostridium sp.]